MKLLRFAEKNEVLICILMCALFLTGCSFNTKNENSEHADTISSSRSENVTSIFLDEYLKSAWLNHLQEEAWDDIKEIENGYIYEYRTEINGDNDINKKLTYTKNSNDDYEGLMTISFSEKINEYVITISKDFASHVDELNFSIEPSEIINPDPIIKFENLDNEIIITSKETKTKEEIVEALERQVIETETNLCEKLTDRKQAINCALSLVSKYRNSAYIQDELSGESYGNLIGASAQAVLQSDLRLCRHVTDADEKALCYEYAYQILVKDCDKKTDKEYRDCIRHHSKNLPSLHEKRLFCDYIDNDAMKKECQGLSDISSCNDIENEDDRILCQLNILRTKNDLSACNKVTSSEVREVCIALIGSDREDADICKKIDDEYLKGQCLTKVAMTTGNKDLCNLIKDEDSKNLCIGHFVMKFEATETMCADASELFLKELCGMMLAINKNNIEKCTDPKIVGYDNIASCLAGIGMKHGNPKACTMIDITIGEFEEDRKLREVTRDLCYIGIALKTKDLQYCDKIIDQTKKQRCLDELNKPEEKEVPRITCSDVGPAEVCPMNNSEKNGATIHVEDSGHDVQCTYRGPKSNYSLYNEVYKLSDRKTRDGTYKEYYENGNIKKYSEYKNNRNEGFSIDCDENGNLTRCWYYTESDQKNIDCLE